MAMGCLFHSREELLDHAKMSKGVDIEDSLELVICLVEDRPACGNARVIDQDRRIAICLANFLSKSADFRRVSEVDFVEVNVCR
jgi:hypothetical protein